MAFLPAYPAACRWFEFFQKPLAEKALLLITLWAIFSGFLWWLDRWLKILKTIGQAKWKGWAAAGLATLIGLILFHWLPPAFPSYYQVEIRAEGKARLVQVFSGGHILPLDQFVGSGGWNLIDAGWEQSGAANESLTYSGSTNAPMELDFSTGSESGTAAITLQGKTTAVNLNTPLPDFVFIQPFRFHSGHLHGCGYSGSAYWRWQNGCSLRFFSIFFFRVGQPVRPPFSSRSCFFTHTLRPSPAIMSPWGMISVPFIMCTKPICWISCPTVISPYGPPQKAPDIHSSPIHWHRQRTLPTC